MQDKEPERRGSRQKQRWNSHQHDALVHRFELQKLQNLCYGSDEEREPPTSLLLPSRLADNDSVGVNCVSCNGPLQIPFDATYRIWDLLVGRVCKAYDVTSRQLLNTTKRPVAAVFEAQIVLLRAACQLGPEKHLRKFLRGLGIPDAWVHLRLKAQMTAAMEMTVKEVTW